MGLTIFHGASRRVFRAERARGSDIGHRFGGAVDYAGLNAIAGQSPVHLLFRLNMEDPAVGVTLPGIRWLPLLCAIRYGACNLGYRVKSDTGVEILHQGEREAWDDFPYDGFPENLPAEPVAIREVGYDPGNPEDAFRYAGVFGYDALTPDQFEATARFVVREAIPDWEFFEWESLEVYLREGNHYPFQQGKPIDGCPDRSCPIHEREGGLRTIGIFREEPKRVRKLWGPNCSSLQIIYQICPECGAIRTTNQSD